MKSSVQDTWDRRPRLSDNHSKDTSGDACATTKTHRKHGTAFHVLWGVGLLLLVWMLVGWIASATRGQKDPPAPGESTKAHASELTRVAFKAGELERGRAIFQGKGNCTICHTVGGKENTKSRGPDLAGIGARAPQRAKQFGIQGPDAATRYLVRSIVQPDEDVVDGYNPAPESWLPSGLSDEDLRHLVVYLRSLGGRPAANEVSLPTEWLAAKRQEYQRELALFSFGNPEKGKELFHDPKGKAGCVKCHTIDGVGKDTCPDLTTVNRVQRPGYILQSLFDSSAFVVCGYRQVILLDFNGRVHTGLPVQEDDETITLVVDQEGKTEVVRKDDIEQQRLSDASIMPAGLGKQLNGEQLLDLVAYMLRHEDFAGKLAGKTEPPPRETPLAAPSLDVFGELTEDQQRYRAAMERGDPVIGARIYSHYCIMCHGAKGDGTGFNAANLATKPADHTDNRRMSKTGDLLLHGVITRSGMKTGRSLLMPPWGGTLSGRDRWDLVAYIRTLHADVQRDGSSTLGEQSSERQGDER